MPINHAVYEIVEHPSHVVSVTTILAMMPKSAPVSYFANAALTLAAITAAVLKEPFTMQSPS